MAERLRAGVRIPQLGVEVEKEPTEADARAKMLVYLIENNLTS